MNDEGITWIPAHEALRLIAEERAATEREIVEWLRGKRAALFIEIPGSDMSQVRGERSATRAVAFGSVADWIERGEYRKK